MLISFNVIFQYGQIYLIITSPQTLFEREVLFYSSESVILFVVLWFCGSVIKVTQKLLDRFQSNLVGRLFKKKRQVQI